MRYIKVFEEFANDELYRKVELAEWVDKAYDDKPEYVNLSNIEKKWITEKLNLFQPDLRWDISWTRGELDDDWFILDCVFNADPKYKWKTDYYICDQFEGLKQFFKEILGL